MTVSTILVNLPLSKLSNENFTMSSIIFLIFEFGMELIRIPVKNFFNRLGRKEVRKCFSLSERVPLSNKTSSGKG